MNTLRLSFRQLLKAPAFTLVTVVTLSLGIGACTLVFSWIRSVLIDTIPGARDPGQLVVLADRHISGAIGDTLSMPDLRDLAANTNVFNGVVGSQMEATPLRIGKEVEWVWAQVTTANYFDVLGVRPGLGRGFRADEDQAPRGNPVVVISHGLWQRRFGADPDILGRTIEVGRRPFTIIGVAPAGFRGTMGGLGFDLWYPVTMSGEFADIQRALATRGWRWLHTVARLQQGVPIDRAQVATDIIMRRLEAEYPASNRDNGVAVLPVWRSPWGAQGLLLPLLMSLAGVAALLLLLVIANIGNLLLARASSRESEMSVRLALGAGARQLIQLVLTESLLLALLGGLGACVIAAALGRSLLWLLPQTYLPIQLGFSLDFRVVLFAIALALVTGVLTGLFPAWRSTHTTLAASLKAGGRSGEGSRGSQRVRQILVAAEIAAALVLLVGMTLCGRSFERARQLYVGLDPRGVWLAGYRLQPDQFSAQDAAAFYRRLQNELSQLPGVTSVALADWLPLGFEGGSSSLFQVPGYQPAPGERMSTGVSTVSHDYFRTLSIPILQGREFQLQDDDQAPLVTVINDEIARRYFPGRDPVGLEIQVWGKPRRIVGVARTGKYRSLNEAPRPFLWMPLSQGSDHTLTAVIRTEGSLEALGASVERVSAALDPNARPMAAMAMTDFMAAVYVVPRVAATLLAILGAVAVFLASLGVYSVIAWSVGRRVREIGVRMALGAGRSEVVGLFVHQALRLTLLGAVVGILGALAGGRAIAGILVGVSATDPMAYLVAIPTLGVIAAVAAWLPARRAAAVDPVVALRSD
ncbi:MAG: ABC transporter permease [Verrucomicrobiales bacterium]|nr:ABC transporter permease [Verrucomicrobiales bacterium]